MTQARVRVSRRGSKWTQLAYVKRSNTDAFDEFGSSVALSRNGGTMVVGARKDSAVRPINGNENDNTADEAGAAYVFTIGLANAGSRQGSR